jgi:hypothetical protein
LVASRSRGELQVDDLLFVTAEQKRELLTKDVEVLAQACDIPCAALGMDSASTSVRGKSP